MEIDHLLDFGCGKDTPLFKHLTPERAFKYQAFDLDVPKYSGEPQPAEMVVCIDQLSPLNIVQAEEALDEIERLTEQVVFLTINTERHPVEFWVPIIMDRFAIKRIEVTEDNTVVVVALNAGY